MTCKHRFDVTVLSKRMTGKCIVRCRDCKETWTDQTFKVKAKKRPLFPKEMEV